MSDNEEVEEYE